MKRAEKGVFSCDSVPVVICDALSRGGDTRFELKVSQLRRDVLGSFFCVSPLPIGLAGNATAKTGRTIATPQKRGFPTGPDSGPVSQGLVVPVGGRYRPQLSLREGSGQPPFGALPERRPSR